MNGNINVFFLKSLSPGQIFRYFERNHHYTPSIHSLHLSDSVGEISWRCLFAEEQTSVTISVPEWMQALGSLLSKSFPPRVIFLWCHTTASSELGRWGFTIWENGEIVEMSDYTIEKTTGTSFLSRLPGMKRKTISPAIAWALARGLPIDRVPAAGLRRHIPIIDYVTVSQLDQRSLLVENTPRLYRFPLNNP
jgi:hypothetical protein